MPFFMVEAALNPMGSFVVNQVILNLLFERMPVFCRVQMK